MELEGVLHLHSETGTEGGYWAFQDKRFIEPNTTFFSCTKCGICWDKKINPHPPLTGTKVRSFLLDKISESGEICNFEFPPECPPGEHVFSLAFPEHWSYDGLLYLENGDHLTVYGKNSGNPETLWSGKVLIFEYPLFTYSVNGMWVHSTLILPEDKWKWLIKTVLPLVILVSKIKKYLRSNGFKQNDDMMYRDGIKFGLIKKSLISLCAKVPKIEESVWTKWFFEQYPAVLVKARPRN